jgi:hypothetical protein
MSNRIGTRRNVLGYGTVMIALATLLTALSMFFASAVDVRAMLTPDAAAMRAKAAHQPVEMPEEWIWRGRPPINLESMYGNRAKPQPDYIVMHRNR